ncbi:unnamed protein product [Victoria cruziana]
MGCLEPSREAGLVLIKLVSCRHDVVDLDYPNQKIFHPLPPNLRLGVYLGVVEIATSFITDELWYVIFGSSNSDNFDMSKVTTIVKGVGEMGEVMRVDLQAPVGSLIGKHVVKVGRRCVRAFDRGSSSTSTKDG